MDVRELSSECCFKGFLEVRRSVISHTLHQGGMSPSLTREHARSGPVVGVLPYDPQEDRVVLIRQFRIGAWGAGADPAPWDIVAGIHEPQESAEAAAARELLEETGCRALALRTIGTFLTAPHVSSEQLTLYCARVRAFSGQRCLGVHEEGEDILADTLASQQAFLLVGSQELPLWTAMALQWLQVNRDQLRSAWSR